MSGRSRRRRNAGRLAVRGVAVAALILVAWIGGLIGFASTIPDGVADATTPTDAIVVLTGGSGRLDAGLALLAENRARKLFISGVHRGVDVAKLLTISQRSPDEIQCCVEIGHTADNTAGNAAETAAWMRSQGYSSLRIVTSGYHMPRSQLEFRWAMPDAVLVPHPVFSGNVKHERWWAWPGTALLIVGEYDKFLLAWLRRLTVDRLVDDTET